MTSRQAVAQTPDSETLAEEYKIYSIVLDSLYGDLQTDTFFVADTTKAYLQYGPNEGVPRSLRTFTPASTEAINSYIARNATSLSISASAFSAEKPVATTRLARSPCTAVFSRVGFNADLFEAVVHLIDICGEDYAVGKVVWLSRTETRWTILGVREVTRM